MSDQSLENAYPYAAELMSKAAAGSVRPLPRYIKRNELRLIVPIGDTAIWTMEKRNEFPHRIALTPRVVVWNLAEVEAWIEQGRLGSESGKIKASALRNPSTQKSAPVRKA
jgi:prophage regulatory protein